MSEMFDRLAKMAAGGVSRRDTLKYLGGFLAGGFLTALAGKARADDEPGGGGTNEEINEACQAFCGKCPSRPASTFGHCMSQCKQFLHTNPKAKLCGACTATNPFTACVTGATCCAATSTAAAYCANLNTDLTNCGKCGNVCSVQLPSAKLVGCCSGTCTDLTTATNCGGCGKACPSGQSCKATTTGGFACS